MVTDLREDLANEANETLARSLTYRLLSQAFAYPTPDSVHQLLEEDLPLATGVSALLPEDVRLALDECAAALEDMTYVRLEAAYGQVFSHVHSVDAPMFETDYTVRDVWRQSRELADLGGFYRAFGMEEADERQDGVCVELEFLHLVSYKAAWAIVQADREHAETCRLANEGFLADHALKWIPGFAARVSVLGTGGPYGAVGRLTRVFLAAEAERFGLPIVEALEPPESVSLAQVAVEETALCEADT